MFCENCGASDMNGNFCRGCGHKLAKGSNTNAPKPELIYAPAYSSTRRGSGMNFTEAISTCFRKYAEFNGRASRAEYWWFALFNALIYACVLFLMLIAISLGNAGGGLAAVAVVLYYFPLLGLLIPNLSVTFRRLHDAGLPGKYFLFGFIPFVGPFILLIFALEKSEEFDNEFGSWG